MAASSGTRTTASPRFITLEQLLTELGDETGPLPRSTFYEWRAKGRGPKGTRLPNGHLKFTRANVEKWLASLEEVIA